MAEALEEVLLLIDQILPGLNQHLDVLLDVFDLVLHALEVLDGLLPDLLDVLLVLLDKVDSEEVVVLEVRDVRQQRLLVEVDVEVII